MPEKQVKVGGFKLDISDIIDGMSFEEGVGRLRDRLVAEEKNGVSKFRFDLDYNFGYSEGSELLIIGDRLETDKEAETREAQAAQQRAYAEEQDRRDYERLQKKFG
jgi:hypothetical protein